MGIAEKRQVTHAILPDPQLDEVKYGICDHIMARISDKAVGNLNDESIFILDADAHQFIREQSNASIITATNRYCLVPRDK